MSSYPLAVPPSEYSQMGWAGLLSTDEVRAFMLKEASTGTTIWESKLVTCSKDLNLIFLTQYFHFQGGTQAVIQLKISCRDIHCIFSFLYENRTEMIKTMYSEKKRNAVYHMWEF